MKQFDSRSYSIADFLEWRAHNLLDLSPRFQRRSVWTRPAKSYLIDTILRGKPMPKVLLTQDLREHRNVRTVVDGQQRIRSILEFVGDSFTVLASHNEEHAGKSFSELTESAQEDILQYEIGVDLLYNVDYSEMLDIFARINTYSVTLNTQEKRNGRYLGIFKKTAYDLGHDYVKYFLDGGILTEQTVSRMGEAELASDMLMALLGGVQTSKNLDKYYKKYEDSETVPSDIQDVDRRFRSAMQMVGAVYPAGDLKQTNWRRPPLFYTLFTCVAHVQTPLIGWDRMPRPDLASGSVGRWRISLDGISALFDRYTGRQHGSIPQGIGQFINYSQRRTRDTDARKGRAQYVLTQIAR